MSFKKNGDCILVVLHGIHCDISDNTDSSDCSDSRQKQISLQDSAAVRITSRHY